MLYFIQYYNRIYLVVYGSIHKHDDVWYLSVDLR